MYLWFIICFALVSLNFIHFVFFLHGVSFDVHKISKVRGSYFKSRNGKKPDMLRYMYLELSKLRKNNGY